MKKTILFGLLMALGIQGAAQASCSEDELNFKRDKALPFRVYALQGQGKLAAYTPLGLEAGQDFATLHAQYSENRAKGQAYLDRMCAIMDKMIVLADDLLAGEDGLGKNTPWMSHRPEDLLQAENDYHAYCQKPAACETGEAVKIREALELLPKMLVRGAEPARLVDENYERIEKFLPEEE